MLRRLGALTGATLFMFGIVATVFADAANPDTVNVQIDGSTVTLSGSWSWFSRQHLGCDAATDRMVGWAVDWGDPNDPGNQVGTSGFFVGTATDNAVHSAFDCGSINADDFPVGTWGPISHTYTESGDYDVCVLMYDIHRTGQDHHIVQTGNHGLIASGPDRNRDNSAETNGVTPTGGEGGPCIAARFHISAIQVEKSASASSVPAGGGEVTFTYTVTNVGQAALSNVSLVDDKCSPLGFVDGDTNGDSKLDLGETWTYDCTKAIVASETNVVIVTAQDETTEPVTDVSDDATVTVEVAPATPAPPTAVPTPVQSVLAATNAPGTTVPPTSTIGDPPRSTGSALPGVLMALGLVTLLSSLLMPSRAQIRERTKR